MLPQVLELLEVPVPETYQLHPDERHAAVIVTNGEVEEESLLEFEKIGLRTQKGSCSADRLMVWGRGELLSRFRNKVSDVWSTDIEGMRLVLETFASDGQSLIDTEALSNLLVHSIGVPTLAMRSPEKDSRISSALLLGEIIKAPWYASENHYVLFQISTMLAIFCLRYADDVSRLAVIRAYDGVIVDHCRDLIQEAQERSFEAEFTWAQFSPLDEIDIMKERLRLVADVCATLVLSGAELSEADKAFVITTLGKSVPPGSIWGEGAIPSLIVRYWALRRLDPTVMPDQLLRGALIALVRAARHGEPAPPSPYYNFEECLYLYSGGQLGTESDIADDSSKNRSWFSFTLMQMLAKRNWKQTCRNAWQAFSKLLHERVDLPLDAFFDARLVKAGRAVTTPLYSDTWHNLVKSAVENDNPGFPHAFADRAWLIASYVALVPYRAWQPVMMWLDTQLSCTWYNREHLPEL